MFNGEQQPTRGASVWDGTFGSRLNVNKYSTLLANRNIARAYTTGSDERQEELIMKYCGEETAAIERECHMMDDAELEKMDEEQIAKVAERCRHALEEEGLGIPALVCYATIACNNELNECLRNTAKEGDNFIQCLASDKLSACVDKLAE